MTRRAKGLLAALAALALLAAAGGRHLQRSLTTALVLGNPAPSEAAFAELTADPRTASRFLTRAWSTGRVVHRQRVVEWLNRHARPGVEFAPELRTILVEATRDADHSVREAATGALASLQDASLPAVAWDLARDPDPELRVLGARHLGQRASPEAVPLLISLLEDRDLLVAANAEAQLRNLTGVDFGGRVHQAIPRVGALDEAGLRQLEKAFRQRRAWWDQHRPDYPAPPAWTSAPLEVPVHRFPVADFQLPALEGGRVRLSDFRGKAVLLNFWATWCTACLEEIPDLVALHRRHGEELVILGIALDGAPDEHGHDPGNADESGSEARDSGAAIRARVGRTVAARGIPYRVLLDPQNRVAVRFNGGELPTNVLIDAEGRLYRRFIGTRPVRVWEALLARIRPD